MGGWVGGEWDDWHHAVYTTQAILTASTLPSCTTALLLNQLGNSELAPLAPLAASLIRRIRRRYPPRPSLSLPLPAASTSTSTSVSPQLDPTRPLTDQYERLEFPRERVVEMALGWGHLVVAVSSANTSAIVTSTSTTNIRRHD